MSRRISGSFLKCLNVSRRIFAAAGFTEIEIEPTRVYSIEDARQFLVAEGIDVDAIAPHVEGKFASAFVRACKPGLAKKPAANSVRP